MGVSKTISFDASTFDEMPPELQEALSAFYSEKKIAEAKKKAEIAKDYQSELADTLVSLDSRWREIDCRHDGGEEAAYQEDWDNAYDYELEFYGEEVAERHLLTEAPTVYQFYKDLFQVSPHALRGIWEDELEDLPEKGILINHCDRDSGQLQLYTHYGKMLNAIDEETSFIYLGRFWRAPKKNGGEWLLAKRNAMISIGGFCVDLDRVEDADGRCFSAKWVMETLVEYLREHEELTPNYLMLSGTGIQLWYVFGEQIPLLSAKRSPRRKKYQQVLRLLYERFERDLPPNRFKVDTACATICHAFRAPGSNSKLHYPTRMFVLNGRKRGMIKPIDLSDTLGGDLKPYDCADWNQEAYTRIKEEETRRRRTSPATEKQLGYINDLIRLECIEECEVGDDLTVGAADALIRKGELVYSDHAAKRRKFVTTDGGRNVALRTRDPKLYEYTLDRIWHETPTGSRYNALFGLAGLGYNCGIEKKQVEKDMLALLGTEWAKKVSHDGLPLRKEEVKDAMKGYCALGALRPRHVLEGRLEWQYGPPAKRNGRDTRTHLRGEWLDEDGNRTFNKCKLVREEALKSRFENLRSKKTAEIAQLLSENPSATKRQACAELGMSATTVTKYWADACCLAGVDDVRTGNHSPK